MKSLSNKSTIALFALLFACACGGEASGQVVNLILLPQREATIYDYVDKLPPDKKNAIAVITGDQGSGTGFFAKIKDTVFLVTNMHVLCGQNSFKARTINGTEVRFTGMFAAREGDIALLKPSDEPKEYFDVETSVDATHRAGDPVLVPGNSLGGGTILQTEGVIAGIGPDKIEHNAPAFHGNSGGPILCVNTWKVLGVHTMAISVTPESYSDAHSLMIPTSQIKSNVRRFGYRLDNVTQWEPVDWSRFNQQAKKLEEAEEQITGIIAVYNDDMMAWRRHPRTNTIMRELENLLNTPRIADADILKKKRSIATNFCNTLKKIEQDAFDSKRTCYGYISENYQDVAIRAKAAREWAEARNLK